MSEDGCAKASIDCVEETPGNAKMILRVENYCEHYANKDQLEKIQTRSGCQGENVEPKIDKAGPQVLLLGPSKRSEGKSMVLSLPDLKPLDCNIPVFPYGDYYGYVGMSTSDGVLMCGGWRSNVGYTSSCYLLTSSGYQDMPALMYNRYRAAALVTPMGLWVTGGNSFHNGILATTELVANNKTRSHVTLPENVEGHCIVKINNTHSLVTGGWTRSWVNYQPISNDTRSAHLYSEDDGFLKIEDMSRKRNNHGCSLINNNTVIVVGGDRSGYPQSSELLDLTTMTWSVGPKLYQGNSQAAMIGNILIGKDWIYKLEEEVLEQTTQWHWTKMWDMKKSREDVGAFIVNQNMFCNN